MRSYHRLGPVLRGVIVAATAALVSVSGAGSAHAALVYGRISGPAEAASGKTIVLQVTPRAGGKAEQVAVRITAGNTYSMNLEAGVYQVDYVDPTGGRWQSVVRSADRSLRQDLKLTRVK